MIALSDWDAVWRELGAAAGSQPLHSQLVAAWSEPHRHYHSLKHLLECLVQFGSARGLAQRPAEVALALWFHDAVYDPARKDNEDRSAQWARAAIVEAGLPREVAERVAALVMLTKGHEPTGHADGSVMLDVDLAILGAEPLRFAESNRQIRREYAHVPQAQYREGRSRVLRGFLDRPRLYCTDHFHSLLEARARANLAGELARLARS